MVLGDDAIAALGWGRSLKHGAPPSDSPFLLESPRGTIVIGTIQMTPALARMNKMRPRPSSIVCFAIKRTDRRPRPGNAMFLLHLYENRD
jgi:hypothetical protein